MLHLEHRLDQELLRVAVVSPKGQDFADNAAARLPVDVDNEINGFSDLRFGIGEGGLRGLRMTRLAKRRRAFSAELA
jgi:hypothetical protein